MTFEWSKFCLREIRFSVSRASKIFYSSWDAATAGEERALPASLNGNWACFWSSGFGRHVANVAQRVSGSRGTVIHAANEHLDSEAVSPMPCNKHPDSKDVSRDERMDFENMSAIPVTSALTKVTVAEQPEGNKYSAAQTNDPTGRWERMP